MNADESAAVAVLLVGVVAVCVRVVLIAGKLCIGLYGHQPFIHQPDDVRAV